MKRCKRLLLVCIAACSLILGGCGETLHELTPEEEALIVHYAAYVVAKHNIQQKDGMSNVYIPEVEEQETESVDTPLDTELPEGTQTPEGEGGTPGEETEVENTTVLLADAIGHSADLTITYAGSYVADNYIEGSAYSLDATEGNTFYIMKFTITNATEADVMVDNLTKGLSFKLESGDVSAKSEVTFLMTDFSTYVGTIAAGQSVETILLFEVPESSAEAILEPTLQIIIGNEIKNVKL